MEKVKLGDVCKVQGGYAFKSKEFQKDSIPIIRIGNIQDNEVEIDYNVCFTKEFLNKHPEFEIKYGDILIAMSGATVGKIGKYQNDTKALLNQRVGNFIVTEKLEKRYLYFLLQSPLFEKFILNNAFGCAQPNISSKQIEEFEFYNYDNVEQIEIANQLDKVQEIIDFRKKQIQELDELIKSQFVEMFGNIYDNKNNYSIKELDYYTSLITYGLTIRPKFIEKGIDLISAREINTGIIDYDKAPKISEDDYNNLSEKAKPKKNEILFSKTGTIGLCAIIEDERKFAITQNAARIVTKDNINPLWLLYYLRTDEIQNYCKRQAKGNAVKDFQIQDMKKIPILDCPISIQNKFVEKVKLIDKQKFEIQKSLEETQKLQESLMNKYFG